MQYILSPLEYSDACECVPYQLLYAFIQKKLCEVRRELLHSEAASSIHQVLQLVQTVAEMVVGLTGNVHVSQGEVHPCKTSRHSRKPDY